MTGRERRARENEAAREWKGGYRRYDLVKEFSIAIGVVLALSLVLTILFSSPDDPPSTIKTWSRTDPVDFVTTAVAELDGSSGTAGYGPPYNHGSEGQHIAFIRLQKWLGVSHPINTTTDFVLDPLRSVSGDPALTSAISTWTSASSDQQTKWTTAYTNALNKATANPDLSITVPPGDYGPVPTMMDSLLTFAQGGGLDGALLTNKQFYQNDYTKPLLFMADGGLLASRAQTDHLLGDPMGDDERDRQLSRSGVAMAIHVLVPDQTVLDLDQRRHPGDGCDGGPQPRLRPGPAAAGHPRRPPPHPALQADLARPLPRARKKLSPPLKGR